MNVDLKTASANGKVAAGRHGPWPKEKAWAWHNA